MKKRPMRLRQASAYWRLAQKARQAGKWADGEQYQKVGGRKLREHHAEQKSRISKSVRFRDVFGLKAAQTQIKNMVA